MGPSRHLLGLGLSHPGTTLGTASGALRSACVGLQLVAQGLGGGRCSPGTWLCPAPFSVAVCLGSGLAPAWLPTRGGTRAALPRPMACAGGAGHEASWAGAPAAPSSVRLLPVSAQQPVPCPAGDLPPADEHHKQVMSEGQAAKRRLGSLGEP